MMNVDVFSSWFKEPFERKDQAFLSNARPHFSQTNRRSGSPLNLSSNAGLGFVDHRIHWFGLTVSYQLMEFIIVVSIKYYFGFTNKIF